MYIHKSEGGGEYTIDTEEGLAGVPNHVVVEIYNTLSGKNPIKKFENKVKGVTRTWPLISDAGVTPVEAAKPAEVPRQGRQTPIDKRSLICVNVNANPKREGSAAHARFAHYFASDTVGEFLRHGGQMNDIRWDLEKGFIGVIDYKGDIWNEMVEAGDIVNDVQVAGSKTMVDEATAG